MYRSESMNNCEECTGGKETNAEKSECGECKTFSQKGIGNDHINFVNKYNYNLHTRSTYSLTLLFVFVFCICYTEQFY